MLNRQLTEWGIEPIIGYFVASVAFLGVSIKLFEKTQYAEYIYIATVLSIVLKFSEVNRNEFLQLCYQKSKYIEIRLIENLLFSIPFVAFLIFNDKFLISILLLILAGFFAVMDLKSKHPFIIPTPFYKYPFEFTVGFRTNYFMFFIAYFLAIMAIHVDNFNLGIFSLILVFLSCLSYFTNSENEFYVWVLSLTPKEFIKYKFIRIIQYSTLLCFPIAIGLSVCFYTQIDIILGFQLLGYLFVFTSMLAKYSEFPEKLTIKHFILFGITIWLPALLLLLVPYLYIQSIKKLKVILQ